MHDLSNLVTLAQQYGPAIIILLFFLWKDWRREIRHCIRIETLEDEIRGALLGKLTKNTEVLTRVEKRLDDWQLHVNPAH
jgi:hypothetical protein